MYFFVSICRYVSRLVTSSLRYITSRTNLFLCAWHFASKITARARLAAHSVDTTRARRVRAARAAPILRTRIYAKQSKKRYARTVRTYLCCMPGGMSHQWCVRGRFARTAVGRRADGRAAYVSRGQPVDVRNYEDPTPHSSDH